MISQEHIEQYNKDGFLNVNALFSAEEVAFFREHFEAMGGANTRSWQNLSTTRPLARSIRLKPIPG